MYSDITGYAPEWLIGVGIAVGAIAVVCLITVAVTLTAGAAAYVILGAAAQTGIVTVMLGAASGGLIAGSISIVGQALSMKDSSDFDFGTLAIDTFFGSSFGAISGFGGVGASLSTKIGVGLGKVGLSALTTGLHGINDGKSSSEIWRNIGRQSLATALIQTTLIGGGAMLGGTAGGLVGRFMNNTNLVSSSVVFGLGIYDYFIDR